MYRAALWLGFQPPADGRRSLKPGPNCFAIRTTACALLLLGALAHAAAEQPAARSAAAPSVPADPLVGLWTAKKRFGPDARGELILERSGGSFLADVAGDVVPVIGDGAELSFELPGGRGRFRGRLEGDAVRGFWERPGTPETSSHYASPVVLKAQGRDRWSGLVTPLQDEFTFFLLVEQKSDGLLGVVLRNPERDVGTQIGARRLVRVGDEVRLLGGRPGEPEQVLATGWVDPETKDFSLRFSNRGGTYDFTRDGNDSEFYPRSHHPSAYVYHAPPPRDDAWAVGSLAEAGIDEPAMRRLVQGLIDTPMGSAEAPQIHALLIARHGRLVLEEYFHGYDRDRLHDTRSAGKSVTAVTLGAAMRAGVPLSLTSLVYQVMNGGRFPAHLDPLKRSMTLEHLLTMSSGYFCDDTNDAAPGNEETMQDQTAEPDWYRYTLKVPMATPPGENSVYCSASPNLALGMLGEVTGETPLWAFDHLVAVPMTIRQYAWPLDPVGHPYGGGGLKITARDFLKFGQLMLNGGVWQGQRLLDSAFAANATAPLYHLRNVYYGYLWWVEDYPYKSRTVRSYSMRGAGGQVVTVVPELDLVVETMAGNYSSRIQITYTGTIAPRLVLPAVREPGDDPHAPVKDSDFVSKYGRSSDGSRVAGPAGAPAPRS